MADKISVDELKEHSEIQSIKRLLMNVETFCFKFDDGDVEDICKAIISISERLDNIESRQIK